MEYLYIALGIMVTLFIINQVLIPPLRLKNIYNTLLKLEDKGFMVSIAKNKNYEFILENEDITFLVKTVAIPSNSAVTINSKNTWKLSWGGSSANKGRAYPHDRYLVEIKPFLNEVIKKEKKTIKLILLYKSTEKILMYLNESELDLITPKMMPYGYKVTSLNNIEKDFDDLINIK